MLKRYFPGIVAAAIGVAGCAASEAGARVGNSRTSECTGGIFTVATGSSSERKDPALIRQRPVTVDFSALESSPSRVVLNLFDNACLVAVRDAAPAAGSPGGVWTGTIEGVKDSSVSLVVNARTLIGSVVSPPSHFQIRLLTDGIHVVTQVDPSKYRRESQPTSSGSRP